MINTLEQQNFPNPSSAPAVFASDPSSVINRPENLYYQKGVDVNYTAPAKWWNWLWNHISAWLKDSKADRASLDTEIENVLTAASVTPSSNDSHQLSKSVDTVSYNTCGGYNNAEITEMIDGVEVTHKINQPYVVRHTLYLPETELL